MIDEIISRIESHRREFEVAGKKPEPFYLTREELIEFLLSKYAMMWCETMNNKDPRYMRFQGVPLLEKPPKRA
jgi:hypothetical protein